MLEKEKLDKLNEEKRIALIEEAKKRKEQRKMLQIKLNEKKMQEEKEMIEEIQKRN